MADPGGSPAGRIPVRAASAVGETARTPGRPHPARSAAGQLRLVSSARPRHSGAAKRPIPQLLAICRSVPESISDTVCMYGLSAGIGPTPGKKGSVTALLYPISECARIPLRQSAKVPGLAWNMCARSSLVLTLLRQIPVQPNTLLWGIRRGIFRFLFFGCQFNPCKE